MHMRYLSLLATAVNNNYMLAGSVKSLYKVKVSGLIAQDSDCKNLYRRMEIETPTFHRCEHRLWQPDSTMDQTVYAYKTKRHQLNIDVVVTAVYLYFWGYSIFL